MQVRRRLGDNVAVPGVDLRLRLPGVVRVQRVTQLVGERADGAKLAHEVHQNERMGAGRTAGKGAAGFTDVRMDIDPAIGDPLSDDADVRLTHRCQRVEDEINTLLVAESPRWTARQLQRLL